jgi:hypothetical protein
MPLALSVLGLVVLALSTPSSAAGPGPARTFVALSTRVVAGSLALAHPPAPPSLAAAAPDPAGIEAPYGTDLIRNGGFETGNFMYWSTSGAPVVLSTGGHTGSHSAQLGGRDNALDRISQTVACPFSGNYVEMAFYLYIHTTQPPGGGSEYLKTVITDSGGGGASFWTYIGDIAADTWVHMPITVGQWPYACEPGETWQVIFEAVTDAFNPTWFLLDDVSLAPCCADDPREPNNDFAAASAVSPGIYDLRLCPNGDEDWFRFDATASQLIYLRLQIVEAGQATVCLVSPAGQEVGCDWDVYPYTATLARTATMSGSWRARVHDPGYHTFGMLLRLGIEVNDLPSTATPTPTPTLTRTATPTATATRTPPGITPRVYLPLVLKNDRPPQCSELVVNGGFESGLTPWGSAGAAGRGPGRTGAWGGWLGGQNNAYGELIQWISLPTGVSSAPWEFWWRAEAASQQPGDVLRAFIQAPGEEPVLLTLPATGTLNTWRYAAVDLSPYAGKGFFVSFGATTDAGTPTTFRIDDVSARSCVSP